MIDDLIIRSALSCMHVAKADVITATNERDSDRKMRFEVDATNDGPKVRRLQGHTLPVTRANVVSNRPHQRCLQRATDSTSAAEILRSGTKQMKSRQEFHCVELMYDSRQARYLANSNHVQSKLV